MDSWSTKLDTIESTSDEWRALADQLGASPFAYPGWFSAWAGAFGGDLRALTVRKGADLQAVASVLHSRRRLRSPTNSHTPLFEPVARNEVAEERLIDALFKLQPTCLDFCHVRSDGTFAAGIERSASERGYVVVSDPTLVSAYIPTDGSWDDYERSIHRRRSILQHLRRLRRSGTLQLDVRHGTEDLHAFLEEGFRVERSGWRARYGTAIDDRPERRRFYTEVAQWAAGRGWLRLTFLRLDGRAIAFDFSLETNGTHYVLKTGYDVEFAKRGPGNALRYLTVQQAFADDAIHSYDLLGTAVGSHNEWKLDWTTHYRELGRLQAFSPTIVGTLDRIRVSRVVPVMHRIQAEAAGVLNSRLKERLNRIAAPLYRRRRE